MNRLTQVRDALQQLTTYQYDAAGNRIRMTDRKGQGHTYTYDQANRLTQTSAGGQTISYTYDANGNRLTLVDPTGTTQYQYDHLDRLKQTTNPDAKVVQATYDAVGNRISLIDPGGVTTTAQYDAANRLITMTQGSLTWTFQYDGAGNRTRLTHPNGTSIDYAYLANNWLQSITDKAPGGAPFQSVTYGYDPNGNRISQADPSGTTTFAYDAPDRLTSAAYPAGYGTWSWTYDPGGVTTTATYDAANRLTHLTQGTLTWTVQYDGAGNRTRLTHPNGTSIDYAYLANHWLQSITDKAPGGTAFQSVSYTYDQNGNRTSQTDSSGTTTFTYDALNRLTQAAYPGTYGTWGWIYDAVGNRTQQTAPRGTTNYTYDANNRLLTAGSTTYSYDANGNLLTISTGQTFAWDVFNRLTQATGPGGTVTHTYNGDGLKTRRVGPDGTRNYYYDGIKPIWETDAAGAMTAQLDRDIFGNLLSRREASGARRYYHFDGLGSTTALTSESGAVTATLLYDAWGNQRAATGSDQGRYRFTGAELDQTTGLYHMGARFYDPVIGRWLREDPVQDKPFEPATLSLYAYVNGNPLVLVDQDGQSAEYAQLARGFAVVVAGGAVVISVPAAAGFLLATAAGIAIGVGASIIINEMAQASKKQAAGLANIAAIHLADYLGRSVGGRDSRPGKDRRNPEEFLKMAKEFIKQAAGKAKGEWGKFVEFLKNQGWSQSQIDDFLKAMKDAGIDPSTYFTGGGCPRAS